MALSIYDEGPASLDMRKALYAPIGAASPLWFLFGGAATAGLTFWWMTRWTAHTNLEALLSAAAPTTVALTPEPEVTSQPSPVPPMVAELIAEAAEIVEGVTAAATDAVEQAAETLLEPLADPAPKAKPKSKPPEEPPPGI